MNFYKHHIGDYAQATAHLTFVEDAAYARLIRKYYAHEKPIPADLRAAQRLVGARTREEKEAIETVLGEFFELREDGWHNRRCDAEIAKANAQAETNRQIAQEREARKRERERERLAAEAGNAPGTVQPAGVDQGRDGTSHGSASNDHESLHESSNESLSSREPSQTPDTRHQDSKTPDLGQGEINRTAQPDDPVPRPSIAPAVCLALKAEGVGSVSPGHPRLLALLAAGAEVQNFVDAARLHPGKNFAYLLGTVEGQMADARRLAAAGRSPAPPVNGHSGSAARAARMAEARKSTRPPPGDFIDTEARDVTPRRVD
jgi:uncharacterized protein YdaU (DUF1376 family)